MIKKLVFLSALIITISACARKKSTVSDNQLTALIGAMTGSYDSEAQAAADSTYYNIALHMYPIWEDQPESYLYVEQSLASMPDKPYRQRVYKVASTGPGRFVSWVYTIPSEEEMVGSWQETSRWADRSPNDLTIREGCEVYLAIVGNSYTGKTNDKTCASTLRGATFATSSVTITPSAIESWDRGWDQAGQQVWGAEKAGYIFDKKQ